VELSDGSRLGYKVLSVNLGSEIALDGIEGASELGVPVKPVRHFAELRAHWSQLPKSSDDPLQVVVIGGGPAGCESAANARRLLRDLGLASRLSLVTHEEHLLERHAPAAHATMLRWLNRAAVEVRLSSKVARLVDGQVELEDGETLKCDVALLATGVRPSPVVAESGLTTADDGSFVVNEQLQSVSHPEVFGGGDCISLQDRPLDRVGVYAVRQGPVLHRNVLAAATGAPLKGKFRPQKRYLLILNLGDGTGLLLWNRFVRHGRWAFKLKDWLDRRFVTRFQEQIPSGGAPSGGDDESTPAVTE
jgi:NADH dehydrogenase FAD-containing subunit